MRNFAKFMVPVLLVSFIIAGCGASETKPIPEVRAEAEAMSAKELQGMVDKYKAAIDSRKADLKKVQEKISKIPISDLMGDEAKKLKGDIDTVTKSIRALTDRLNIYARELRAKS
jgi:hypothetical protein